MSEEKSPTFDEPWQAQVYAISQVIQENGLVKPADWAETLGGAIRARLAAGADDTTETYFRAVTDALEEVLSVGEEDMAQTVLAWRTAFESTPHGKPVVLAPQT